MNKKPVQINLIKLNKYFTLLMLKVNKMKTTYTLMAILATTLFTQTATAKLGNRSSIALENKIEINVEAEIINNINEMLANVKAANVKNDVSKQLEIDTVESQTNELVQATHETLPAFKFKVVIAD